ncbi:hypothetical protein ACFL55_02210, partial [Candidatus Latescibacterota bacterium]
EYSSEKEFEELIILHAKFIFGNNSLYIDVKKKIGIDSIVTIPDGYLIDFSFEKDPRLYIIENELVLHDPYKHIGQQLLKFAISYKVSGRKIKSFLLDNILANKDKMDLINSVALNAGYRNIDDFFEGIIFDKPIAAVVIIDEITSDIENVLSQLTMKTDIIEFQTFCYEKEKIHKFTPFQQEIRSISESTKSKLKIEELDTIVVPALEEGFKEVFIGENCWYSIRISSSMLNRIKFIAAYQTAPISAITYYAEVAKIEKYKDTNKYIVFFKEKAKEIGPIKLPKNTKGIAPQGPRYTSFTKMEAAKTLSDIF